MKKNIATDLLEEIEWLVEKAVPKIQYKAKLDGIRRVEDWRCHVLDDSLNTTEDVATADINTNLYNFGVDETHKLLHVVKTLYPDNNVIGSGAFLYPPTGYMGWHTNSDSPGKRLYIVYCDEDNQSFFKYYKDGKVITDYDKKGINIREFDIPEPPEYLWHCVGSNCNRYSFGFRIS